MSLKSKQLWFLDKFGEKIPDGLYLRWKYRLLMGRKLHLKHPRTFTEKLQWMKLNDRDPRYTTLADKHAVKHFVAERIGPEHIVPTLGVWRSPAEIDYDSLPDQFVLKCNHDSGSTVICRGKGEFDREAAAAKLAAALSKNYAPKEREWAYRDIRPVIIAEKFMGNDIADYKFFCFNGRPEFMFIATDRYAEGEETKFDFFDMDFLHLDVRNGHPNAETAPSKPEMWEEMKALAAKLAEGLKQVRIDLYQIDGRIYFGEYTFYHWGGFVPFEPEGWDEKFGRMYE